VAQVQEQAAQVEELTVIQVHRMLVATDQTAVVVVVVVALDLLVL
jgi:hypothetical protein